MRLPPDKDSLNAHLDRVNNLAFCQKNYMLRIHPSPIGHGWHMIDGKCRPVQYSSEPLPADIPVCAKDMDMYCDEEGERPVDSALRVSHLLDPIMIMNQKSDSTIV